MTQGNTCVAGLSFEERCDIAKSGILQLLLNLRENADEQMYNLQSKFEAGEQLDFKSLVDGIEDVSQIAWESTLESLSTMLGSDTVEHVVEALKREHQGN